MEEESEYEALRRRNMARNDATLALLGIKEFTVPPRAPVARRKQHLRKSESAGEADGSGGVSSSTMRKRADLRK